MCFEYSQHMFWLKNKKNNFQVRTLIWRPVRNILSALLKTFKTKKMIAQDKPKIIFGAGFPMELMRHASKVDHSRF